MYHWATPTREKSLSVIGCELDVLPGELGVVLTVF